MSHADKIRQRSRVNQAKVITLTGISQEELAELKFNTAYSYLKDILQTDEYGMEHLPKTSQFWAWWGVEWSRIDQIFLAKVRTDLRIGLCTIEHPADGTLWACYNKQDIKTFYLRYHEVDGNNIFINAPVMEASCHQMLMEVTGSVKQLNNY